MTAYILATVVAVLGIAAIVLAMRLRKALDEKKRYKQYALKLRNAEKSLKQHAFFDPLTGLANRLLLVDRFQLSMQHAKRSRKQFAVLMIDLNKFKAINDTYGHAAGDTVLITVAQRLVSAVRASDTVARLGGDEFALIIESVSERDQIATLGQKLVDLLTEEVTLDSGDVVSVGASIGIALYPQDGTSIDEVFRKADLALYSAKESGKNSWRCYESRLQSSAQEKMLIKRGLREAIANPKVQERYQMLVDRINPNFGHAEQIKKFALLPNTWDAVKTDGSEAELTPTLKLRRKVIAARYAREIDAMYADS